MVMKPASTEDSGIISVEPIDPHMRLSDLSNLLHARIDGTSMMYHALAAVDRMQEVVKEMRTTDCDGRDIPRFADRLEGKSNE